MEVAISHRNHNIAGPHPVEAASLIVGGMVRIEGQRGLGQYQGGLLPLCKKILGFIAKLCQASYKSNAKTTYRTPPRPSFLRRQEVQRGRAGHPLSLQPAYAVPHSPTRVTPPQGASPFDSIARPFALSLSKGPSSPRTP